MTTYPLSVRADRTALPGRWLWLVKWLLLLPHYLVLAVLWVAFVAVTAVAYVMVLFTGRYPPAIHGFATGVLRWTWRVGFYGYSVLGTDRYPPFTLAERPDYPAGLTVEPPRRLPRWLPLVAWLLALPHLLILAAMAGAAWVAWEAPGADQGGVVALSVIGVAVLIAAVALLFTGRYPTGLYDLLAGLSRWWLRVVAYVTLLTGAYPPFRLDQGEREPAPDPDRGPVVAGPDPVHPFMPATATRPDPPGPARSDRTAVHVVSLLAGVLLFLVGGGIAAAGGAVLAVNADREDGYVSSATVRVESETAVVTAEGIRLDGGGRWALDAAGVDGARLTVVSDRAVFVGVAEQSDLDRWLGDTGYDELVQPAAGVGAELSRSGGQIRPVAPPADQSFWIASASGTDVVTLDWSLADMDEGTYALVLANADGSTAVTATARASVTLPDLAPFGFVLLGIGVLLALVGVMLVYIGAAGLGSGPTVGPAAPTPPAPAAPAPEPRTPVGV
ncbi:MAG TPA: DUF4389 domain-containing protein [Micromonosporaceae bacterium]|nr:DUF4389 domain-containing protein [Micromonosporaceae bacterium]